MGRSLGMTTADYRVACAPRFQLKFSDEAKDDGFYSAIIRVNGLIVLVCRLKAGAILFFIKSLEGRVIFIHDYHGKLAIVGGGGFFADNVIAVADVFLYHTVT